MNRLPDIVPLERVEFDSVIAPRGDSTAVNKTRLVTKRPGCRVWLECDRVVIERDGKLQLVPWAQVTAADVDHEELAKMQPVKKSA